MVSIPMGRDSLLAPDTSVLARKLSFSEVSADELPLSTLSAPERLRVLVRARDGRSRIHSDHHADAPDCGKAEGAHAAPGVLGRADDPAAALDDQPGADALRHALRNE